MLRSGPALVRPARRFGVKAPRGPVTLIVAPNGKVVWKHEGEIEIGSLSATLGKSLVARTPVRPSLLRTGTRIGQAAPNFIFEYAAGREITFSKLAGRPSILFFLKPSSSPIVDALRQLRAMARGKNGEQPMVFAIVDGKTSRDAKASPDIGDSVTIVPDPDRKIASAYGVTVWPTTLLVDSRGIVTSGSSMNDTVSKR